MATMKLTAAMVHSGYGYALNLSGQVTVGEIAQYLSHYEPHLSVQTLEIARPIRQSKRLGDIDLQIGDRLLGFAQPVKQHALPESLKPGDKILSFASGDFEINSRGKRELLVGRTDPNQQMIPDIDLRYFVAPQALEFIARGCLWLNFDEGANTWYAAKIGQTRIMVDAFKVCPSVSAPICARIG